MSSLCEEFENLVHVVCDRSSSVQSRQSAERRLTEIQNDDSSWNIMLNFLSATDDNLLFFIGQGLAGIAWRNFNSFNSQEQQVFTQAITSTLTERDDISPFARSKIEQVLAVICATSCSLLPVLSIVKELQQPGFQVGLSALRTVMEEVLKDDPRIPPEHQKALLESAAEVAVPLSDLVCGACSCTGPVSLAATAGVKQTSLQLMRELVVRLPVGPHLSFEVLTCLFALVEQFHREERGQAAPSAADAVLAVEVLTEVMSKRHIPPASDGDTGAGILVELLAQAVTLLQRLVAGGRGFDDCETALPLLDFVQVFVESHMQRCIQSVEREANTRAVIEVFLDDFSNLTRATAEPEHLLKIVIIWEGLLDVEAAKAVILRSDSCLQAGFFLFDKGVVQKNEALMELIDDIEEDMETNPFTDQKVKSVLEHITGRRRTEGAVPTQLRTDEGSSAGFALLQSVNRCVTVFAESPAFAENLGAVVQELLAETLGSLSDGTATPAAALDCVYLLRLVPLFMGPQDIIPSLLPVVAGMLQARSYSRGKCFVYLFQSSCKFLEALLMSFVFQEFSPGDVGGAACTQLLEYLCTVVEIACASCDVMISPPPLVVMGSGVILLLQCMGLAESDRLKGMKASIADSLGPGIKRLFDSTGGGMSLPIEVGTLLFCATSHLYDNIVTITCEQWMGVVSSVKARESQGVEVWTAGALGNLSRYNAFLDALSRYRSNSSPAVRQLLIAALGGVSENIDWVVSSLLQTSVSCSDARTGQASVSALMNASASTVSLSQSMLQNLGKKNFFQQASSVVMLCHSLLCSHDVTGSALTEDLRLPLIFEGAGLEFTHQALSLTRTIASASASSGATVSDQLVITHQILCGVSVALADKALCADLLEEVLRCGWTAVSCYWKGDNASRDMPLISFLMDLFDACMDPSVPPHDALLSLEGPLMLNESKNLFKSDWFRATCWDGAVTSCLKVFLLGVHCAHHDSIALMLRKLLLAHSEASVASAGSGQSDILFWPVVCGQVLAYASDMGCGERVEELLMEVTDSVIHPMLRQGQDIEAVIDVLFARVLRPVAVLVSRCQAVTAT